MNAKQTLGMHIFLRSYQCSAGYILFAAETKIVKPWGRALIRLDLLVVISEGHYGRIVERSVLAKMHGIIVHDGVIDSDYWGIVCVVLFNLSNEEYLLEAGNCIIQLIVERCFTTRFVRVSKFMEEKVEQGEKVYGFSGV